MPGRRRIKAGEQYVAGEDVELETVEPDAVQLAEADQHGDPEHEGGPEDQGDEPEVEVPF
jgi:hypothetical protein